MKPSNTPSTSRRLEIPVLVDSRGRAWAPGVIDATLRHQDRTVLAESPPPGLPADKMRAALVTAAGFVGGRGASGAVTVAFSFDSPGELRFLESVPGLPEGHALVEALTGLDLAALQVHLSRGGALDGEPPEPRGHALQICLSARDPEAGFAPSVGIVEVLRLPAGAGLRADPLVDEGAVPPEDDPSIVRVTAQGRTRNEALLRLQRGLARTAAMVRGGGTDKAFLAEVLDRTEIETGAASPSWIDKLVASGEHLPRRGGEAALLEAAIFTYDEELSQARASFYASAARGRPEVPAEIGSPVELGYRGNAYSFRVARLESRRYRIEVDGRSLEVQTDPPGRTGRKLTCGSRTWHVAPVLREQEVLVEVNGVPHRVSRDAGCVVRSPAPAVVTSLSVAEGDEVATNDPVAVIEAMKMEATVLAPCSGRVRKVFVRRNSQVGAGDPLLVIEPAEHRARPSLAGKRVRFEAAAGSLGDDSTVSWGRGRAVLEEVRRLILGYDVDPRDAQRAQQAAPLRSLKSAQSLEEEILRAFVDIAALFHRRRGEGIEDGRRSTEEYLFTYLRDMGSQGEGLPAPFLDRLRNALAHYGVESLERTPELEESLFRIAVSQRRFARQVPAVLALLERMLEREGDDREELRDLLDRLIAETQGREPAVHDLARALRYRRFDRPVVLADRERIYATAEADLARLAGDLGPEERAEGIRALIACTLPLQHLLSRRFETASPAQRLAMLEVMLRRYYRIRELGEVSTFAAGGQSFASAGYPYEDWRVHVLATHSVTGPLDRSLAALHGLADGVPGDVREVVIDLYAWRAESVADEEATAAEIGGLVAAAGFPARVSRVTVDLAEPGGVRHFTWRRGEDGAFTEETLYRNLHPMMVRRLELWRFRSFRLERLEAPEGIFFFRGVAHENPRDERLLAIAEVRDLTPVRDAEGRIVHFPQIEQAVMETFAAIRRFQAHRPAGERLQWNRVLLSLWPVVDLRPQELNGLVHRLGPLAEGLGLEKVLLRCRIPDRETGEPRDWVLEISDPGEAGRYLRFRKPSEAPLKPLRPYAQQIVELRRRGLIHPHELVKMLAPAEPQPGIPAGKFAEHDLDAEGRLAPVHRPPGGNTANLVAGVVRSFTGRYPEGMARVVLLSDPSRGMGSLAEPECRIILAALDLAERMGVPLEWFAVSAGARISLESGTENMDWIARVLRRLVEFTQAGGEVNLVVHGVNAGAQPYWNAEATMLMHTRGILIMTPEGAMVLTGKQALDYSGGVSAEDNLGIGGYERIMGPNGQAQYFAADLGEACRILLRWYEHTWKAPGERFPRPAPTTDPRDRDVRAFPHGGAFHTVGEVFSPETNPGRKKPFEIRRVMEAVIDQDHGYLERWYGMRDAEIAVVWDAHLGGSPVCLLGFESKPLPRLGYVPGYGPDAWTGGTLFPQSSKKVARAINAASGNRPLVVLANLSGFDGSPESMRLWQLEYGAEIGRAVVNFQGPIVFCVISRYHGGAFVVFSNALHDNMEVAALEGTYASVIGGAPAAAVVFAREVDQRTKKDPRIVEIEQAIADPETTDKAGLRARLEETRAAVRSEKLGEVAEEFDRIHSVQRAQQVGSIHHILPPERLRPYLIEAVERGMARS